MSEHGLVSFSWNPSGYCELKCRDCTWTDIAITSDLILSKSRGHEADHALGADS